MRRRLEVSLQVHNEWMINDCQDFLLTLDVINLLQLDDGTFLEAFESKRLRVRSIAPMLDQAHTAECTCTEGRQDVEIVEEEDATLFSLGTILNLLLRLIVMH